MTNILPVGKLPADLLAALLAQTPIQDERVLVGPGIGLDCAVINLGATLLVLKSDPITFTTAEIGWYAVHVNANDIATTGATPRWFLATLLLPEGATTPDLVAQITHQLNTTCQAIGVSVVGGHTEITYGLTRPLVVGTMIGEVTRDNLITPRGASPGDQILLTKGVPIEATAILARDFAVELSQVLSQTELAQARAFLHQPGISVLPDAQIATRAGRVTAMHDPTEGGLAAALWELAEASGRTLLIDPSAVPVPPLSERICRHLAIDPLAAIASGALLLTAPAAEAPQIAAALAGAGITCATIGQVGAGPAAVYNQAAGPQAPLPRPDQDEIARLLSGPDANTRPPAQENRRSSHDNPPGS